MVVFGGGNRVDVGSEVLVGRVGLNLLLLLPLLSLLALLLHLLLDNHVLLKLLVFLQLLLLVLLLVILLLLVLVLSMKWKYLHPKAPDLYRPPRTSVGYPLTGSFEHTMILRVRSRPRSPILPNPIIARVMTRKRHLTGLQGGDIVGGVGHVVDGIHDLQGVPTDTVVRNDGGVQGPKGGVPNVLVDVYFKVIKT